MATISQVLPKSSRTSHKRFTGTHIFEEDIKKHADKIYDSGPVIIVIKRITQERIDGQTKNCIAKMMPKIKLPARKYESKYWLGTKVLLSTYRGALCGWGPEDGVLSAVFTSGFIMTGAGAGLGATCTGAAGAGAEEAVLLNIAAQLTGAGGPL